MRKINSAIVVATMMGAIIGTKHVGANDLKDQIASDYDYLSDLFTHFHQNPELSFMENESRRQRF